MSTTPAPVPVPPSNAPTITPHLIIAVVGFILTELVSFGFINPGLSQHIIADGGIVIPSVWAIAASLHLGRVHAAQVSNRREATTL